MNKKSFFTVLVVFISLFFSVSCEKKDSHSQNEIFEIRERMFMGQVNDVYKNRNSFLGRTIRYEGLFTKNELFSAVFRYGPGCCGDDGKVGFEVRWEPDHLMQDPAEDSWVEVTGILKEYEYSSLKYLYLEIISLVELNKRGAVFVRQ